MAFKDTIKLAFGHNIIMGNTPDKLTLDQVANKVEKDDSALDIASFGLFDSNTANYNTYYPEVTAEDLAPKESEFITPTFRALSEVIVHKEWNPVDFGIGNALKKSASLLKGQTINSDHETAVGNALGAVSEVGWQNSMKTPGGIIIPAGINAKLKIDGKSHPRVARAIMMDPPAIHSTSVTVQFLWEKSHADLTEEQFWAKLGTYHKDGQLIRRIATDVKRYHEISLVSHGADPYAQKIIGDQIVNPKFADVSYNKAHPGKKPATKYFFFDMSTDLVANSAEEADESEETIPHESNNNNNAKDKTMNKAFLLALALTMGLKYKDGETESEYNEENITEEVIQNALSQRVTQMAQLSARPDITAEEVTRLQAVETQFNALPKDITALNEFMTAQTTELRAAVIKNLNTLGKNTGALKAMVENPKTSYETLSALNITYAAEVEEKFPLACKKCGSKEVNRASVKLSDPKEGGSGTGEPRDNEEVFKNIRTKRTKTAISGIHGKVED